jgi:hypothetical protein
MRCGNDGLLAKHSQLETYSTAINSASSRRILKEGGQEKVQEGNWAILNSETTDFAFEAVTASISAWSSNHDFIPKKR